MSLDPIYAQIAAAAFADDPLFEWALPDVDERRQVLLTLFEGVSRHCQRHGELVVEDAAGIAGWVPGENVEMTFRDVLAAGLLKLPFRASRGGLNRLRDHDRGAESLLLSVAPSDFAYLAFIAVDPPAQRQGIGRRLVDRIVERTAGEFSSCALRVDNPANVPIYERLGFGAIGHEINPASGLDVWVFARDLSAG